MSLEFVPNQPQYYEFMRLLRNDHRIQSGFIEQVSITPEQQAAYMEKWASHSYICLVDGHPAGYIGEIDGDIRIATHADFQKRGVAIFMLKELLKRHPNCFAKVKVDNDASLALFRKAGFEPKFLILEPSEASLKQPG